MRDRATEPQCILSTLAERWQRRRTHRDSEASSLVVRERGLSACLNMYLCPEANMKEDISLLGGCAVPAALVAGKIF